MCLCSRCSQTFGGSCAPDRAKINVANVVPVLGDNPVVLGAIDASNEQFFYTVTSSNSHEPYSLVPRLSPAKAGRWPGNEANSPVNLGFANTARGPYGYMCMSKA